MILVMAIIPLETILNGANILSVLAQSVSVLFLILSLTSNITPIRSQREDG